MAGRVTVYDFKQVICVFGPIPLGGYAEGDAISVEFDAPQETKFAGSDGDVVRVKNASKMATATVRLQRGSVASSLLRSWKQSVLPPLDQAPFTITDISGALVHQSLQAWIEQEPAASYGAEAPVDEWKFGLAAWGTVQLLPVTG